MFIGIIQMKIIEIKELNKTKLKETQASKQKK